MKRIILAECEPQVTVFLQKELTNNRLATEVAKDGDSVITLAQSELFDLLILSQNIIGKDGWAVLKELRSNNLLIPIIFLSSSNDIHVKVKALDSGANDYVTRPFQLAEFLARIRVQLRSQPFSRSEEKTTISAGKIEIDLRTRQVKMGNNLLDLSAKEFALAEMLVRHPGQVISRELLLNYVWGYDYDPNSNIVNVYIGYLRKKFGNDLIETVRGIGYRLRCQSSF